MLSSYYKKLHKLHDISADAYEISDQESAGESDGAAGVYFYLFIYFHLAITV